MKTHGTLRDPQVQHARRLWRESPTAALFWDTRISLSITVQEAMEGRRLALADMAQAANRAFEAHDAAVNRLCDMAVAELEAQEPCAEEPVALCNGCGREACFVDRWCVDEGVFVEYQQCLRCGAKSAPGDPEAVYYA